MEVGTSETTLNFLSSPAYTDAQEIVFGAEGACNSVFEILVIPTLVGVNTILLYFQFAFP